jgi:sec-independent protein translocase protein TatA
MVGFDEVLLIAVAALLLFGPDKLPHYLRELGRLYAEVKKAQRELERELNPDALLSAPAIKMPSPQVIEIAKKLGINTDAKTEDELLREIDAAVPRPAPAADSAVAEKDI